MPLPAVKYDSSTQNSDSIEVISIAWGNPKMSLEYLKIDYKKVMLTKALGWLRIPSGAFSTSEKGGRHAQTYGGIRTNG